MSNHTRLEFHSLCIAVDFDFAKYLGLRICVLDKLGKGPWHKFANNFKDLKWTHVLSFPFQHVLKATKLYSFQVTSCLSSEVLVIRVLSLRQLDEDNLERWKQVFDSDNPLAEHWPGKAKGRRAGRVKNSFIFVGSKTHLQCENERILFGETVSCPCRDFTTFKLQANQLTCHMLLFEEQMSSLQRALVLLAVSWMHALGVAWSAKCEISILFPNLPLFDVVRLKVLSFGGAHRLHHCWTSRGLG